MKVDVEKLIGFLLSDKVIENNIPESLRLGLVEQGLVYDKDFGFVEMKFRVGDKVKYEGEYLTYVIKSISDDCYKMVATGKDGNEGQTCFSRVYFQDKWKLVGHIDEPVEPEN